MAKRVSVIHDKTGVVYKTMSEAEKAFGIPSGMLSEAIKLGKPCRGELFHVVDPSAVNNSQATDKSYPYIRAWVQFVHPDSEHFLREYLLEAVKENAPQDAAFKDGDRWVLFTDITNEYTKKTLEKIMRAPEPAVVPTDAESLTEASQ